MRQIINYIILSLWHWHPQKIVKTKCQVTVSEILFMFMVVQQQQTKIHFTNCMRGIVHIIFFFVSFNAMCHLSIINILSSPCSPPEHPEKTYCNSNEPCTMRCDSRTFIMGLVHIPYLLRDKMAMVLCSKL